MSVKMPDRKWPHSLPELNSLKQEKPEIKKNLKIVDEPEGETVCSEC